MIQCPKGYFDTPSGINANVTLNSKRKAYRHQKGSEFEIHTAPFIAWTESLCQRQTKGAIGYLRGAGCI